MRILVLSPRVAPGLLTLTAWDALREASRVLAAEPDDPQVRAIVESGIEVASGEGSPTYDDDVLWIAPIGGIAWAHEVATALLDDDGSRELEVVMGSYDVVGARLLDLVDVMDQLRSRCPWTQQQTHASLSHYLLEEAYETLEALDSLGGGADSTAHVREELGDLLMQVVFHARIAAETGEWDIDDVAAGITEKLIRRNPHVFGDVTVSSAEEVDANWQAIKAQEKGRAKPTDGIPAALPALAYAEKVLSRLGDVTVDGSSYGERLLALVQEARADGVDAEEALRQTVRGLAGLRNDGS